MTHTVWLWESGISYVSSRFKLYFWIPELWNMKLHYHIHKTLTLDSILSHQFHQIIFFWDTFDYWSWDSVVGIVTGYGLDNWGVRVWTPVESRILSTLSRPALRPTQPPSQWVPGALSPGQSRWDVKLTTYLRLIPRSIKCGSINPLPHMPSWCSA
jgi:hypothetical protein